MLKWNGWGYKDSKFIYDAEKKEVRFTGRRLYGHESYHFTELCLRYPIGEVQLPLLVGWVTENFDADFSVSKPSQQIPPEDTFPKPRISDENLTKIANLGISYSTKGVERLVSTEKAKAGG